MIVYTGGTFDGLHVGHLELLRACRHMAGLDGKVVVGLNRDEFVVRYKRRAPRFPYAVREELLRAVGYVDLVVCNIGDENSGIAIDVVHPDVLAIGSDWEDKDYYGQLGITQEWLDARRLYVEYIPRTRGVSSTSLRDVA